MRGPRPATRSATSRVPVADGAWKNDGGLLTIALPAPLATGREAEVTVAYSGVPFVAPKAPWDGGIVWSKTSRGPYMPTPLAYNGVLYSLNNDGIFDAYEVATGREIYRKRLDPIGSGFSASPVAADGRLYLSSEDGEMLVIAAGREFRLISTNTMGELLMATPALSNGVMYVRSSSSLFAIGTRRH